MARILIVDAEPNMRLNMAQLLILMGYEVAGTVADGSEAFHLTQELRPDIVLMDIAMPGHADGFDTAKRIREELDIPIILLTGHVEEGFIQRAKDVEPYGYLLKPFPKEQLKATIELALHKKVREGGPRCAISMPQDTERRTTGTALKKSEEFFRLIAENAKAVIWMMDLNLRYTYISPYIKHNLDYSPEEYVAKPLHEVMTPSSVELCMRVLNEELESEKGGDKNPSRSRTLEAEYIHRDGRTLWAEMNMTFIRDEAGAAIGILGITRDISDAKKSQEALRQNKQEYDELISMIPTGIYKFTVPPDGKRRFDYISPRCSELLGIDVRELMENDHALPERLHSDDVNSFTRESEAAVRNGSPFAWEGRLMVDQQIRWIQVESYPHLQDNGDRVWHGVLNDITERKMAKEALQESEERFRSLVDQMIDSVIIIDWNGTVLFANATALKLVELDADADVVGRNIAEFIDPANMKEVMTALSLIQAGHRGVTAGCKVITENGHEKWVEAIGTKVHFKGTDGDLVNIRDVTERKRMEEELLKSHKLESVGALAGGIAHDFNNLLAGIYGYIELIKDSITPGTDVADMLSAAEQATMQAAELTKRLITFSRGGDPVKKLCDVADIVKDAAAKSIGNASVDMEMLMDHGLWQAEVDEGQIRQVIRNLVLNAAEAMPGGGRLTVRTENVMIAPQSKLPLSEGPYVRISVEDTGTGISAEQLPLLFDPYYSTKERGSQKGMGLGLSVCYSVVNRHNGYIKVESARGKGSIFHVYLPATIMEMRQLKLSYADKQPDLKGRILVMDDEAIVRDMISQLLTAKGYRVHAANDGLSAIDLYLKARESGESYDLLILDLTVKGGMGGKLTIERILSIDPQVKAIILSGYTDDPVIQNYKDYGFVGALTKPFALKDLLAILEKEAYIQGSLFAPDDL